MSAVNYSVKCGQREYLSHPSFYKFACSYSFTVDFLYFQFHLQICGNANIHAYIHSDSAYWNMYVTLIVDICCLMASAFVFLFVCLLCRIWKTDPCKFICFGQFSYHYFITLEICSIFHNLMQLKIRSFYSIW